MKINTRSYRYYYQLILKKFDKKLLKYLLFTLSFFSVSTICLSSYANTPQTAIITEFKHKTGRGQPRVSFGESRSIPITNNPKPSLKKNQDAIYVPGGDSSVNLQFKTGAGAALSPIVQTGYSQTESKYSFPCKISGTNTIGWGLISENGCRFIKAENPTNPSAIQFLPQRNIAQTFYKQFFSQSSSNLLQYCSAIDSSESAWGISFSFDPSLDPCQKAIQECLKKSSGNQCSPVYFAEESINKPNLIGSLQCTLVHENQIYKRVYTTKKDANIQDELTYLKWKAEYLNRDNCALVIYREGDVIVSPANDGLTLIQIETMEDGNIAVDVLIGKVTIISYQRPWGLNLPQGLRYVTNQDYSDRLNLTVLDCPKILQSSSMVNFLDANNWLPPVQSEIEQYRRNFCQTRPQPNKTGGLPISISIFLSPQTSTPNGSDREPQTVPSLREFNRRLR